MTQKTHEALEYASTLAANTSVVGAGQIAAVIRRQHALIVQMAAAFEDERFEHDDQRTAMTAAKEYLK
jgi:hypothetical protein